MNFYDAHQHFHFETLIPYRAQVERDLRAAGVAGAVVNGTNEEEWPIIDALAKQHAWIIPSFGVHPWDSGNRSPRYLETLRTQLQANSRIHVGEVGLDRWIVDGVRADDPRIAGLRIASIPEQSEVFAAQLALAAEFDRAVSIHCVQAWGAVLEILTHTPRPARGFLLHGYAGPAEMIKAFTELGAYYSFNIQLLEPRHAERLQNFKAIPAERLLVETDAPAKPPADDLIRYPLPDAADGSKVNHPANIVVAYEALAKLRGVSVDSLATQVEENFRRLFG